jgi:hypothetical protein
LSYTTAERGCLYVYKSQGRALIGSDRSHAYLLEQSLLPEETQLVKPVLRLTGSPRKITHSEREQSNNGSKSELRKITQELTRFFPQASTVEEMIQGRVFTKKIVPSRHLGVQII